MDSVQKILFLDAHSGLYKIKKERVGDFYGPVDLGFELSLKYNSLNLGVGLLAGSIFPGSNRLIFTGLSPCWGGFFISSMGGAGLVFENLGINMLCITGKADTPSILYLNRVHAEEIQVELVPIDIHRIWESGRGGVYAVMDYSYERFGETYKEDPRILAVGPASAATDFGAIGSVPIRNGKLTSVDTWAGRGGFGTKLLQQHGLAGIIYGGTVLDDDFKDRKLADQWFEDKYNKKLMAKDFESTTKYRFDPKFNTGGTFGVNFSTLGDRVLSFNYSSIAMGVEKRKRIHSDFIVDHYLKQFNEETISKKQQFNCGEPCPAICKKMNHQYKKDYEPYQTLGPLSGIFDQRAAEKVNHFTDRSGFDAISLGGIIAWYFECIDLGYLKPDELGISAVPVFSPERFDTVADSGHNANLAVEIIENILKAEPYFDFRQGARLLARKLSDTRHPDIINRLLFSSNGRYGWMVPSQYWTPGVIAPMPITGKYYMYYNKEFLEPNALGYVCAERMRSELIMDNLGICRFHRAWAEDMLPEIVDELYGKKEQFLTQTVRLAGQFNNLNTSVFWESEKNQDFVKHYLIRNREIEGDDSKESLYWLDKFNKNKRSAAFDYWHEIRKGLESFFLEH